MTKKALLIVDVQNDFCPGGALPVTNGDEVVELLNKMIEYADLRSGWMIIASRDYHPPKTSHFKEYGGVWPVHCVQNTKGAEFHPDLKITPWVAFIVTKGTGESENAYSAFDGKAAISWTSILSLEEILRKFGVEEVYIGGLATDYCVKDTALDAVKKGFRTYLLEDACRAVDVNPGDGEKAIAEMEAAGVTRTITAEVINEQG
ncbi:MAG: nicotinamidase [Parcubacteria group bacterium]|nr:nicotinamidase [Parcubacteria group bacterium]